MRSSPVTPALRLKLVWSALAVVAVAAVAADVGMVALASKPEPKVGCPSSDLGDPYRVAARFLTTAVQRTDLAASYRLAAPSLRGGRSCAQWAHGQLPIREFRDIDWSRAAYQDVAGGDGQVVIRVLLYRPADTMPVPFLMELQTDSVEPGWHVGSFQPDRWYRPTLRSPAA
jgi:hypothetical protein